MIRSRLQIGLRKFFLVLAACASWFAYWGNETQRSIANTKLIRLLEEKRTLNVQDTSNAAACITTSTYHGGGYGLDTQSLNAYQGHQCFVPDSDWEICIATRDVLDVGYPSTIHSAPIRKGTSEIEISVDANSKSSEIKVRVEGKPTFDLQEDKTWMNAQSLQPTGMFPSKHAAEPNTFVLTRLQFLNLSGGRYSANAEPPSKECNGVLLWIRKTLSNNAISNR